MIRSKKIGVSVIKLEGLDRFMEAYQAPGEDRIEISENGTGNYIYFTLKDRK